MKINKNDKTESTFVEVDVKDVMGLDYEPSDREVGIFSASYCLGFKDTNGKVIQLYFGESEFEKMLQAIKEHIHDFDSEDWQ